MANTGDTFKIIPQIFQNAYVEQLGQMTDAFNAASMGTINLTTESSLGDYEQETFFKALASTDVITHRDPSADIALSPLDLEQGELFNTKVNRTYGPVRKSLDAFKKIGTTSETFSVITGELVAQAVMEDQLNTAIYGLMGAIQSEAGMVLGAGDTDVAYTDIASLMGLYGDQLGSIKLLVMHSTTYFTLMQTAIGEKLWNVAGNTINDGANPTLGIPTLVTDTPALAMTAGKGVLALTDNAITVVDSETTDVDIQKVLGNSNMMWLYQGESAFNLRVKGYSFDVASITSPTNAELATDTNWSLVANDLKFSAGGLFNTLT